VTSQTSHRQLIQGYPQGGPQLPQDDRHGTDPDWDQERELQEFDDTIALLLESKK